MVIQENNVQIACRVKLKNGEVYRSVDAVIVDTFGNIEKIGFKNKSQNPPIWWFDMENVEDLSIQVTLQNKN